MGSKLSAKPSKRAPLRSSVDKWCEELDAILREVRAGAAIPNARDRNRRLKLPSDGDGAMKNVLRVAKTSKIVVGSIEPSDIETRFEQATQLRKLAKSAERLRFVADVLAMQLESGVWSDVTALYTIMNGVARRERGLATELAVARAYFKRRRNHTPAKKGEKKPDKKSE